MREGAERAVADDSGGRGIHQRDIGHCVALGHILVKDRLLHVDDRGIAARVKERRGENRAKNNNGNGNRGEGKHLRLTEALPRFAVEGKERRTVNIDLLFLPFRLVVNEFVVFDKANGQKEKSEASAYEKSKMILDGLGGKDNITNLDCCATRLRVSVKDPSFVSDATLKESGAKGVIKKGVGIQVVYGPQVSVIKSELEDYLKSL